jgi:hypothetical protein
MWSVVDGSVQSRVRRFLQKEKRAVLGAEHDAHLHQIMG